MPALRKGVRSKQARARVWISKQKAGKSQFVYLIWILSIGEAKLKGRLFGKAHANLYLSPTLL